MHTNIAKISKLAMVRNVVAIIGSTYALEKSKIFIMMLNQAV